MSKTLVYLVDDDEAVRDALSLLLGTYGYAVSSFADPTSLLAASETLRPGCLLVDLRMPAVSGLQLLERLGERGIDWPFIVITGHGDIHACRRAFKAGAVDFLTKPIDEQVLVEAVQAALARLDTQQEDAEARQLLATLTDREREVLEMVSRGWATKQIAEALAISPRTIDTHRAHIAEKLGTSSVAEFVRIVAAAAGR
jgi:FixJ family two-component response regulator